MAGAEVNGVSEGNVISFKDSAGCSFGKGSSGAEDEARVWRSDEDGTKNRESLLLKC